MIPPSPSFRPLFQHERTWFQLSWFLSVVCPSDQLKSTILKIPARQFFKIVLETNLLSIYGFDSTCMLQNQVFPIEIPLFKSLLYCRVLMGIPVRQRSTFFKVRNRIIWEGVAFVKQFLVQSSLKGSLFSSSLAKSLKEVLSWDGPTPGGAYLKEVRF